MGGAMWIEDAQGTGTAAAKRLRRWTAEALALALAPLRMAACRERLRQRRALERLDERLLRDVGIDRLTARREAGKPFWMP